MRALARNRWRIPPHPCRYTNHTMPLVGSKAPLFTKAAVIDGQFSEVSLEKNIKAGKWTVLSVRPAPAVCSPRILLTA